MLYLLYYLSVYSLAWILTESKIAENFALFLSSTSDFLDEVLDCIICTSFWIGLIFAPFFFYDQGLSIVFYPLSCIAVTNIIGTYTGDVT